MEAGAGAAAVPRGLRHVPTVDVLRLWSKKKNGTVRILRRVLEKVAPEKLVQELEELRMSERS